MIKYNVIFNQIFNFLLKKNYNPRFLFCNLIKNSVELLQVCYIRIIPRKYRYIFWLYNNHDDKFKQQCSFCIGGIDVTENYCSIQYFTVLYYECSCKNPGHRWPLRFISHHGDINPLWKFLYCQTWVSIILCSAMSKSSVYWLAGPPFNLIRYMNSY